MNITKPIYQKLHVTLPDGRQGVFTGEYLTTQDTLVQMVLEGKKKVKLFFWPPSQCELNNKNKENNPA